MTIPWPKVHAAFTFGWLLMAIPALTIWKESLLFVIIMSLWANVASHWSAYQASKADERIMNSDCDSR